MKVLEARLWGDRVGALGWDATRGVAQFQYDGDFLRSGLHLSPLRLSATRKVQQFPELAHSARFLGLPGFIADTLPGKFGKEVMRAWLASRGRQLMTLTPLERLSFMGEQGMGALEYLPAAQAAQRSTPITLNVGELISTAVKVVAGHDLDAAELDALVAATAGCDGFKAAVGWNSRQTQFVSGQVALPQGFEHYLLKFDSINAADNTLRAHMGRIEYAYNEMAHAAGINVMESRLHQEGKQAWFMARRFDRVDGNSKVHRVTYAGLVHADTDPAGAYSYEQLFQSIRELGLGQETLNEMYRRMVFNICARNFGDHTASHEFLMFGDGEWQLAPASDVTFGVASSGRSAAPQQMSCNGKRDNFELDDLLLAAKAADVKRPLLQLERVHDAIARWPEFAGKCGLGEKITAEIGLQHRLFIDSTEVAQVVAEGPAQGSLF